MSSGIHDHAAWPLVGVVALAAYAWAWRHVRVRSAAGIVLLLPLVQGLSLSTSSSQLTRYMMPGAPILALAAAITIAHLSRRPRIRIAVIVLLAMLSSSLVRSPSTMLDDAYVHRHGLRAARAWLGEQPDRPFVLVGGFAQLPPSLGRFDAVMNVFRRTGRIDTEALPLVEPCPHAYQYTRRRLHALDRHAVETTLEDGLRGYRQTYGRALPIAVVTLAPESPFRGYDYDHYNAWQEAVAEVIEGTRPVVDQRAFDDGAFAIRLYR